VDLMFEDREDAGRRLAGALAAYAGRDPLVLAIPRGAVPMSWTIAQELGGELDVALVRKLGAPGDPEFAIGAVSEGGDVLLDPSVQQLVVDPWYVEQEVARQRATLRARRAAYTPLRPPIDPRGRLVIVVDDGVATGSTMVAALRAVRARGPAELVAAVAVAAPEAIARLEREADRVVALHVPWRLVAVGHFFRDFSQVSDDEVARTLRLAALPRAARPA